MKQSKEVYYLQDPSPDPFLASDLEADQLRKFHYLENAEYQRYKRKERLMKWIVVLTMLILAGLAFLLLTVDLNTIDALIP